MIAGSSIAGHHFVAIATPRSAPPRQFLGFFAIAASAAIIKNKTTASLWPLAQNSHIGKGDQA